MPVETEENKQVGNVRKVIRARRADHISFCLALSAVVKTMAFTLRDMGATDNLSRGVTPA